MFVKTGCEISTYREIWHNVSVRGSTPQRWKFLVLGPLKSWMKVQRPEREAQERFGTSGCKCKRERKREQRAGVGAQRGVYLAIPARYHQSMNLTCYLNQRWRLTPLTNHRPEKMVDRVRDWQVDHRLWSFVVKRELSYQVKLPFIKVNVCLRLHKRRWSEWSPLGSASVEAQTSESSLEQSWCFLPPEQPAEMYNHTHTQTHALTGCYRVTLSPHSQLFHESNNSELRPSITCAGCAVLQIKVGPVLTPCARLGKIKPSWGQGHQRRRCKCERAGTR